MDTLSTEIDNNNSHDQVNIFQQAVALSVELRKLGTRRKLAPGAVQTDADENFIHVSKDILESPRYDDIKSLDGDIRKYLERVSVSARSLFRSGLVLVKLDKVPEIDAALELYKQRREELVARFIDDYEPARERARTSLGSHFDVEDYPEVGRVRHAFSMKSKYLEFSAPTSLRTISSDIYRREAAKAKAAIAEATEEVRTVLRAGMKEVTDHLIDRLAPKADGSVKIFRNTLVDNVREFLDSFATRNIVNDGELEALVNRGKQIIAGVNVEDLRDNFMLRERVASSFNEIKNQLDSMMEAGGGRRFNLEDE